MTTGKNFQKAMATQFFPSEKRVLFSQGEILKIIREKKGMSQNELSEVSGVSQSTISSIENERTRIGVERAKDLARALGVHPAVLAFPDWDEQVA